MLCANSENRSSQTRIIFFFFVQLSKVELEVSRGTYLFLECFQSVLFPPGTIWEFCLWDSWRDRADGKTLKSACGLPSAL